MVTLTGLFPTQTHPALPENRIVIDYGGMADLILLGAVHVPVGRTVPLAQVSWPGPVVGTLPSATFGKALTAPAARLNHEVESGLLRFGRAFQEIIDGLPDGFNRRDFALVAARHELRGVPIARLDGKDLVPALRQAIKPDARETLTGLPAAHASVPRQRKAVR